MKKMVLTLVILIGLPTLALCQKAPKGPNAEFKELEEYKHSPGEEKTEKGKLQGGSLELDSYDEKKITFADFQKAALEHFRYLKSYAKAFAGGSGNTAPVPEPSKDVFRFASALYLHCSVNFGTCPAVLDTILEADIINSRLTKTAKCTQMNQFWNMWAADDMESRHSHRVKIGFLNDTSNFREKSRPHYKEQCEETVKAAIAGTQPDDQFFKSRYKEGAAILKSLERTEKIATFLAESYDKGGAGLFSLVGIQ